MPSARRREAPISPPASPPSSAHGSAQVGPGEMADFFALLKPRVMSLVVFTAFTGFWVAPGSMLWVDFLASLFAIALGAGAAGALNMWYERDSDALMFRTAGRPLPQKRLNPDSAFSFGLFLSIAAVSLLGLVSNWFAAALLALAILYYVLVYTIWLKRRTPQNIVIGGAAGAFPPLIAWVAVTGSVDLYPLLLFSLIFFWTPPHFWALSLYCGADYKKAAIPMMPLVKGAESTKRQMLAYCIILVPLSLAPTLFGFAGPASFIAGLVMSLLFLILSVAVLMARADDHRPARRMFRFSLLYLFVLFAVYLFDHKGGLTLEF